jgi:alpha-D-ribose 1-methylphosphonate 5-triphosphate synthase subunit PhnG
MCENVNERQFEPLPEDAIVYRSLLRKQWINEDTERVKADAYFLRANETGLSVNLANMCSSQQCAEMFRKGRALISRCSCRLN